MKANFCLYPHKHPVFHLEWSNCIYHSRWQQHLTFRSSLSTSAACSVFCSRRSLWISRIHATRLTYGLWLLLRSIPGSLSDLSIREVNKKSPPPLPPLLSLSPGGSFLGRLLLDNLLSRSRLLCLVNLEPITPERMYRWRWWQGFYHMRPKHHSQLAARCAQILPRSVK